MLKLRNFTNIQSFRFLSSVPAPAPVAQIRHKEHHIDLQQALADAEKVAGCSTSLINLRWVTSQNMLKFAMVMRNLSAQNNKKTMLQTLARLIQDNKTDLQFYGLIIVLMSKAGNVMMQHSPPANDIDEITGILNSQHSIAEIVETFRVKNILHDEMKNLQMMQKFGNGISTDSNLMFGNKIALLSGDFLSANIILTFANLSDQETIEMGGYLVRDYVEAKFFGDRDEQNFPLPSNPSDKIDGLFDVNLAEIELTKSFNPKQVLGHPEREWIYRTALSCGSTLGYCCKGAMSMAKMPQNIQDHAYKFGRNFAMALQAYNELEPFRRQSIGEDAAFSLVSAPVLFHMEQDPTIYDEIKKGFTSVLNVNYSKLHREIISGQGIAKTRGLIKYHGRKATEALKIFNDTEAKESLQNLVYAMENS